MSIHNTLSVFLFELRRTLTVSRIGVWLLLVLFPIFIVSVIKYYEDVFEGDVFVGRGHEASFDVKYEDVRLRVAVDQNGQRYATIWLDSDTPVIRKVPVPPELSGREIRHRLEEAVQTHREMMKQDQVDLVKIVGSYRQIFAGHGFPTDGIEQDQVGKQDDLVWGAVISGVVGVSTLLGLLLWATPVVQADLEGRTWVYLAVRPRGRTAVLLGKYLSAVTWTALVDWTSITVCVLVAQPDAAVRLLVSLYVIFFLACLGYGALYSIIGVFIQRRAMVIAVAYTLIFEVLISMVPAVINQFTIQYRLRNLLLYFMEWRDLIPEQMLDAFFGDQPAWLHIAILCGFTVTLLAVANQVIQYKEYVTADEA